MKSRILRWLLTSEGPGFRELRVVVHRLIASQREGTEDQSEEEQHVGTDQPLMVWLQCNLCECIFRKGVGRLVKVRVLQSP